MKAGALSGGFGAGLLECRIAVDEDGEHAEAAAELDVGPGVADDDAGCRVDVGEIGLGLLEEAGKRFAAVAPILVVRAKVEGVDVSVVDCQFLLKRGMDAEDIRGGMETEGDAALIGNDDDAEAGAVEAGDP